MSPTLHCRKTSAKAACCTSLRNRRTSACCSTALLANVPRWRCRRRRTRVSLPRAIFRAASTPGKRRPARSAAKKPARRTRGLRELPQTPRRSGSMPAVFLRLAASSLKFGAITGIARTGRMKLLAGDHPVFVGPGGINVLVASLDVLVTGLNVRNVFVRRYSLNALVVLKALAALDVLDAFVRLHALQGFVALNSLDTLNRFGTLNALNVPRACISELMLQIYVLELHVAVVRRIEFPALELAAATGKIHPVESTVQRGVGLDRRETAVSPIVVVPQGRTDEERGAKSEHRPNRPPGRMPEEGNVSRTPVGGAVHNDRVIYGHINVVRFCRLDDDIFGRACIACAWCGNPADSLFFARFQIPGHFGLLTQCLNCDLQVVGLGEKGLTELTGPVQFLIHHRQHLRYRRQSLDGWVPRLLLHGVLERRAFEIGVFLDPTRRQCHFERISRRRQHLCQ